jgi:outer membrane protein OmpA-like peptidoglycan-associated protein
MKFHGMNVFKSFSLVIYLSFLLTSTAQAINLQGYYFSDSYRYAYLEDTMMIKHPDPFVFTHSYAYINAPLVITDDTSTVVLGNIIDNYKVATLGFSYYLTKAFSLGIDLNYLDAKLTATQEQRSSLGDTTLRGKYRFYLNKAGKWGMAIIPKIDLPTGQEKNFSTDSSTRWSLLAVFEKFFPSPRWSIQGGLGLSKSSEAVYFDVDYRDLILTTFGFSYLFHQNWNFNFETNRYYTYKGDDKQDAGDFYATIKGKVHDNFSLYGGVGIAGFNEVDEDNWTVFLGIKIYPQAKKKRRKKRFSYDDNEGLPVPDPDVDLPDFKPDVNLPSVRKVELKYGTLFKADRVYFANSSSVLDSRAKRALDKVVDYLKSHEDNVSKVIIEGYASKVGPKQYNQILSDARAKNVMTYLSDQGVDSDLLETVAYGDDYLKELPDLAKNRRVEFRIFMKKD